MWRGLGRLCLPKISLFRLVAAKPPPAGKKGFWRDEVPPSLPESADCVSPVELEHMSIS
jgi:hypothetical protein